MMKVFLDTNVVLGSAQSIQADCIVTSNIKDFTFSEIPVYRPEEFLDKIAKM